MSRNELYGGMGYHEIVAIRDEEKGNLELRGALPFRSEVPKVAELLEAPSYKSRTDCMAVWATMISWRQGKRQRQLASMDTMGSLPLQVQRWVKQRISMDPVGSLPVTILISWVSQQLSMDTVGRSQFQFRSVG